MHRKVLLTLAALYALGASESQTLVGDIEGELNSIAKTATHIKKNISYLPHIMSVFENKELRYAGATTLKDAIMLVAGTDMSIDGVGMYNPIFRGSNPYATGQSKLIVDGVEVNGLYFDGYTPYLSMPIELIKRVEVVRGPGSFAAGSNSYAGSIVVTTYQEQLNKQRFNTSLFAGVGSYGTKRGGASYSYKQDDAVFHIDAYRLGDNKKLKYGKDILNYGVYGAANAPLSQSGYAPLQTDTGAVSIFASSKNFYLKARAIAYEQGSGGGIAYALSHDGDKWSALRYTLQLGAKYSAWGIEGELKAAVSDDYFVMDSITAPSGIVLSGVAYPDGFYAYREAKLRRYSVENNYKSALLGGFAAYGIKANWDSALEQKTVTTSRTTGVGIADYSQSYPFFNENGFISSVGAFFEYDYDLSEKLAVNFAISAEKRSKIKTSLNPRLSLVYSISEDDRLKFFISKAHRNPSWQEMYLMNNQTKKGNPDLNPEVVHAYEAQYIHQFSPSNTVSFDIFYLHNFEQTNKLVANTYSNVGSSVIKGCETEWRSGFEKLTTYLAHTYQWGVDQYDKKLANAANHTVKSHLIYEFDRGVWGSAAWRYVGAKGREAGDAREPLKAYQTTDISFGYKLPYTDTAEFQVSVKNLFNQIVKYPSEPKTYADDYLTEGRSFYFTIRGRF